MMPVEETVATRETAAAGEEFLTAEQILSLDDGDPIIVDVPEWKTKIRFRPMSADQAIKFQASLDGTAKQSAWVRIFALCAVNADGSRMFTDSMIEKLRTRRADVFLRLQKTLLRLNGFTDSTDEQKKQEEAAKNA